MEIKIMIKKKNGHKKYVLSTPGINHSAIGSILKNKTKPHNLWTELTVCVCNEEQSGSDEENGEEIDWLLYGAQIVI